MIILSYLGPSFTDVRAVKLVGGLDVNEYIEGLPEASCAIQLSSADDVKLSWAVTSKLYNALAQDREDKGKKFKTELEAQDALYKLAEKVAKTLSAIPPSQAGKAAKDDERAPATAAPGNPKPQRERPPKVDDKYSKMDVNQLAAEAKKRGYTELPAPNGGVRKMRLLNFLRKGPGKDKKK